MCINELYETELKYTCQRFSNNSSPEFTYAELITVYLFVLTEQEYVRLNQIPRFGKKYLFSWFPKLPSYQGLVNRINRMPETFKALCIELFTRFVPQECERQTSLTDSMSIIACKGKKVARDVVDKGYCSTKNTYYYGLKLHILGVCRHSTIPFPEFIGITVASGNDMTAFKELLGEQIYNKLLFGDKIFYDQPYFDLKAEKQNIKMLTPVKLHKSEDNCIRQREKAFRDLFGTSVSTVRQPVASFFNWLNENTKIQEDYKVRSTKGLIMHIFGKMVTAFIYLIFNS
jgi:hypothetical protein